MSLCHTSCILLSAAFQSLLEGWQLQTIGEVIERVIQRSANLQSALIKYHQIDYDDRTDVQEQQLNKLDDSHWECITPLAAAIATCSGVSLDMLEGRERITYQEQPEDEDLEEIMARLSDLQDAHEELGEVIGRACAVTASEIRQSGRRWLDQYIAFELATSMEGICQDSQTP